MFKINKIKNKFELLKKYRRKNTKIYLCTLPCLYQNHEIVSKNTGQKFFLQFNKRFNEFLVIPGPGGTYRYIRTPL